MIILYAICVGILLILGLMFGWSYVDSSVYICEYFAPCLGIFVCLLTLYKGIKNLIKFKFNWKSIATILIGILNIFALIGRIELLLFNIQQNVNLNNQEIFNRVVKDLKIAALGCETDYYTMNIIVYIFPFAIICMYFILQSILNKYSK